MDTTAQIVWLALMQTAPSDRRDAFFDALSPEILVELKKLPSVSADLFLGIPSIEEELSNVHYSWLAPFLRSLPENEIKLFLASLTQEQIDGLKHALLLTNTLPSLAPIGKTYLNQTLFDLIAEEGLLPAAFLPADPLNILLELTYEELTSLIDLLSMHDLSIEIRHIIETSKLKEIYGILSKAQTTFLKTLLHKKEPVSFKKMGLLNWKGDREALRSMLLQRGINRIAKALYGSHPSLLWHIAHRLDLEKGQLLNKLCTALDHPRASALLSDQLVELVNALKHNNPSQNL